MKDLRQSPQYAKYMQQVGWVVEEISAGNQTSKSIRGCSQSIFAYIRKFPLIPISVMKIQRFNRFPNFQEIERVAKKHRVFSVTLEPGEISLTAKSELEEIMNKHKFKKGKWPFLPTKTLRVDLKQSQKKLFRQMKKDARQSIRKSDKLYEVQFIYHNDRQEVKRFYAFWKKYGRGYIPSRAELLQLLDAFGEKMFVVIALKDKQILSGAIILFPNFKAYYYYAVTSPLGRKLFTGYLLVWKAMLQLKKRKCRYFDFEGIYDERFPQLKRWKGFSNFKKKFGGEEVSYPPVYSRNYYSIFELHLKTRLNTW